MNLNLYYKGQLINESLLDDIRSVYNNLMGKNKHEFEDEYEDEEEEEEDEATGEDASGGEDHNSDPQSNGDEDSELSPEEGEHIDNTVEQLSIQNNFNRDYKLVNAIKIANAGYDGQNKNIYFKLQNASQKPVEIKNVYVKVLKTANDPIDRNLMTDQRVEISKLSGVLDGFEEWSGECILNDNIIPPKNNNICTLDIKTINRMFDIEEDKFAYGVFFIVETACYNEQPTGVDYNFSNIYSPDYFIKLPDFASQPDRPDMSRMAINDNGLSYAFNRLYTVDGGEVYPEDIKGILFWIEKNNWKNVDEKSLNNLYTGALKKSANINAAYCPSGEKFEGSGTIQFAKDGEAGLHIDVNKETHSLWCCIVRSMQEGNVETYRFGVPNRTPLSDLYITADDEEYTPFFFGKSSNDDLKTLVEKEKERQQIQKEKEEEKTAERKQASRETKHDIERKVIDAAMAQPTNPAFANLIPLLLKGTKIDTAIKKSGVDVNAALEIGNQNNKKNKNESREYDAYHSLNEAVGMTNNNTIAAGYNTNSVFITRMTKDVTKINLASIMPFPTSFCSIARNQRSTSGYSVIKHALDYSTDEITKITVEFAREPQLSVVNGKFTFAANDKITDIELRNTGDILKQMIESINKYHNYVADLAAGNNPTMPTNDIVNAYLDGGGVQELNNLIDNPGDDKNYKLFMIIKFSGSISVTNASGATVKKTIDEVPWDDVFEVSYEQLDMNPITTDYRDIIRKLVRRTVVYPLKDQERFEEVCKSTKLPKLRRLMGALKGVFFKNPQASVKSAKNIAAMHQLDDVFNNWQIRVASESVDDMYNYYENALMEINSDEHIVRNDRDTKYIMHNNAELLNQLVGFVPDLMDMFNRCVQVTVGDTQATEVVFAAETKQVLDMITMVGGQKKLSPEEKVQKLMNCELFKLFQNMGDAGKDAERAKNTAIAHMCDAVVKSVLGEDKEAKNNRELNFDCTSAFAEFQTQVVSMFANKMATLNPNAWGCVKAYRAQCTKIQEKADTQMKKIIEVMCGTGEGMSNITQLLQARFPMPFKQVTLQHAWEEYNQQLVADIDEFVANFIYSDAFQYMRRIVTNTLPNVIAICLFAIISLGITVDGINITDQKNLKDN